MLSNPIEQLTWIDTDDQFPDDDLEVLIFTPDEIQPVHTGYVSDGEWFYANGLEVESKVVAYCEMPCGPNKNDCD